MSKTIEVGSRVRLVNDTREVGFLAGQYATVEEVKEGEARITLDPSKETGWLGREFWADLEALIVTR